MKTYSSYKDSGIEWLGKIPEHWYVTKLKYLANIFNGNSLNDDLKVQFLSSNPSFKPYIGTKDVDANIGEVDYDNGLRIPKDEEASFRLAPKGSFLLCIEGGSAGKKIAFLDENVFFVNKLACFNSNNKYLYYFANSNFFKNQFNINLSGLISGVSINNLKNLIGLNLPSFEQTQIANYLDKKTTQIDALIAKKEKLIQLLEEERTAIINQAVTKGLNPDAQMKDSGIDWLGEIPEHWKVMRLKYIVETPLKYGANEPAVDDSASNPRYIRITDFGNDGKLRKDTFKSLPIKKAQDYMLEEGDVLFARSGATVGKTFVFKDYNGKACFAGYLIKATCNPKILNFNFLYAFTNSSGYDGWKDSISQSATIENIGADKYNQLKIAVPSIHEQNTIVDFLFRKEEQFEELTKKTIKEIELLKEYKTTLISEVVTGKIDVRGEVLH